MYLLPETIPGLRLRLSRIEEMRASVERHGEQLPPVLIAAERLQSCIVELDREVAEVANKRIAADEDRLARLIAA